MVLRKAKHYVADFETTVYKGQVHTEVWAAACVELFTEDVHIFQSIDEQFNYFKSQNANIICYYHNLKFDGNFWLSYLMTVLEYQQACCEHDENDADSFRFLEQNEMANNTFIYSIADTGQWYRIIIKTGGYYIELRDSLKLLPFTVRKIGEGFKTKHQKLEMEYTGFRYAGCEITPAEREYIANDVLVVKEALEVMYNEGHKKLTIGSCCLAEYKKTMKSRFKELFPNLYEVKIDPSYGCETAGDYIHKSYHGGWCYLARGKERKRHYNGTTADVNSLYPSMMSSESGNRYPIRMPTFWKGEIPEIAWDCNKYFFVRLRTRFYIKKGKLPFIQVKNTCRYAFTEMLETSDMRGKDGRYYSKMQDPTTGEIVPITVELTMTMTDYTLFREHYDVKDFTILDGCYFDAQIGLFDQYIEKYKQQKLNNKGALRELAKLFLNNLYGKMASSTDSSFKVAYLKDDKTVGFYPVEQNEKTPGYIPVGSAITSYARNFTIRAAQKNYYGPNKRGFIYADTDSIHCDLSPSEIQGIRVHDKDFCCWKLESCWDVGYFTRQKTYIEHVVAENQEPIDNPFYNIKCAGMPDTCKELFLRSLYPIPYTDAEAEKLSDDTKDFLQKFHTLEDFNIGLKIPGKLVPRRIRGGVLLVETTYEMR